jgi:hypothetical protein
MDLLKSFFYFQENMSIWTVTLENYKLLIILFTDPFMCLMFNVTESIKLVRHNLKISHRKHVCTC